MDTSYLVLATERRHRHQPIDRSLVAHAVLFLARAEKSRETDDLLNAFEHLRDWGWMPPLGQEVFDLHTREGRERLPRSQLMRHWVEEASQVTPRVGFHDWRL